MHVINIVAGLCHFALRLFEKTIKLELQTAFFHIVFLVFLCWNFIFLRGGFLFLLGVFSYLPVASFLPLKMKRRNDINQPPCVTALNVYVLCFARFIVYPSLVSVILDDKIAE